MKILFVTQWFDPEPTFKGMSFVKELRDLGHDVEVLTGFPNYPGGKLYPGYRVKFLQRETLEGIRVTRVPLYPSHDRSAIRRIANYVSFALSAALMGPFLVRRPRLIYAYHPPASIGLPALVLKAVFRCPLVYDIQDMWPDTLAASGMLRSPFLLKIVSLWCQLVYRGADRIVVLSKGFKKLLESRGVPAAKVQVIHNWADDLQLARFDYDASLADRLGFLGRFNVVFAGGMGRLQGLDSVLKAAKILERTTPRARIVFVGDGLEKPALEAEARALNLANVVFLPRMPVTEVGRVLALADVLLVHLKKDPLFRITIPSKTQAYLAAGKPLLMAIEGDASDLVEEAGAGFVCEPDDPEAIAAAVERFAAIDPTRLSDLGQKGRRFYEERLSIKRGVRNFHETFTDVGGTP